MDTANQGHERERNRDEGPGPASGRANRRADLARTAGTGDTGTHTSIGTGSRTDTDTDSATDTDTDTDSATGAVTMIAAPTLSWRCPVCETPVAHPHRPGRRRVYCRRACRQRAYRRRLEQRDALTPIPRPRRAVNRWRSHAMRSDRDPITGRRAPSGERVTACGTFARDAGDRRRRSARPLTHDRFYVTVNDALPSNVIDRRSTGSCRVCQRVLGVPTRPLAEVLTEIAA